jgi:putative membrane protein
MAIQNFSDHAANERTFLAWIRTAIAVMAFGFLVERFDLFLLIMGRSTGTPTSSVPPSQVGHIAGLILIVSGIAMIAIAALRFVLISRMIDAPQKHSHVGTRFDVALAVMLGLLGVVLFLYLSHAGGNWPPG